MSFEKKENIPLYYKPTDVMDRLQLSHNKVMELIDEGRLEALRLGDRTVRISAESIQRLVGATQGEG